MGKESKNPKPTKRHFVVSNITIKEVDNGYVLTVNMDKPNENVYICSNGREVLEAVKYLLNI